MNKVDKEITLNEVFAFENRHDDDESERAKSGSDEKTGDYVSLVAEAANTLDPSERASSTNETSDIGDDTAYADEVNSNAGTSFSPQIAHANETLVALNLLDDYPHHPANDSRRLDHKRDAGLIASATYPESIAPILVMKDEDGTYRVIDGRRRWQALKEVQGEESEIEVRCVIFEGTDADAVQFICDGALGNEPRSAIETAKAVLNVQRLAGISQRAISERYTVLKKDQVSRMTIAAKTFERFPMVFYLLEEPDRVTIDLCVNFARFMKSASLEDRAAVLEAAEVLKSEGTMLKRNELFEALGIADEDDKHAPHSKLDPFEPIHDDPIMGTDDQEVGAIEMLSDNVTRLRLPDPASMTFEQREEAAEAFIKQIRIYFALEVAG